MKLNKFLYFYPEKPKLITQQQSLFQVVSNDPNWIAEFKYNGSRLELHCFDGKFEFWDRHGKKLVYTPTDEVLDSLYALGLTGYNVFDGELRHNKVTGVRNKIVLYDTHVWQNNLLMNQTFEHRRSFIESLKLSGPLSITQQFDTDFDKVYEMAMQDPELEGIVPKKKSGILNLSRVSNQHSNWMLKVRKQTGRHKF
jgi:ATP-dependent DNA ligase